MSERLTRRGDESSGKETFNFEVALSEYMKLASQDSHTTQHLAAIRFLVRNLIVTSCDDVGTANGWLTRYTSLVRKCVG